MAPVLPFTPPADWTDHGSPGLICRPAGWTSIAGFFISNFVAHAFTVKRVPAQTMFETAVVAFVTLCYPSVGIVRAVQAIVHSAKLPDVFYGDWCPRKSGRTALQRAQSAGALCMVVRSKSWRPASGDLIRSAPDPEIVKANSSMIFKSLEPADLELLALPHSGSNAHNDVTHGESDEPSKEIPMMTYRVVCPPWLNRTSRWTTAASTVSARSPDVHGAHRLPDGYEFVRVPGDAEIAFGMTDLHEPNEADERYGNDDNPASRATKTVIATSNSWLTVVVALYQIIYGSVVLFQARGDQINLYGYSAFGLTVVPYVVMTIVNLVVQIFTDDYPALYMIHTAEMDEAIARHGGIFEGVVGTIAPRDELVRPDYEELRLEEHPDCWSLRGAGNASESWLRARFDSEDIYRDSDAIKCALSPERERRISSKYCILVPCCSAYRRKDARHIINTPYRPTTIENAAVNPAVDRGATDRSIKPLVTGESRERRMYTSAEETSESRALIMASGFLFTGIVLAIIGGLSRFKPGLQSTPVQRGLTMTWFIWGCFSGPSIEPFVRAIVWGSHPQMPSVSTSGGTISASLIFAWALLFYSFPAIGGMAIAGLELKQFGSCIRVRSSAT